MTNKEKIEDLEKRVYWLEIMSGNTRKKAQNSNPYDASQGGAVLLRKYKRKYR